MIRQQHFIIAFLLVVLLSSISAVDARKAVGLLWKAETALVEEDSKYCLEYGAYNPLDEDMSVILTIGGELGDIVKLHKSDPVLVKAGTMHTNPVDIEVCFDIPQVYDEDCALGLVCAQTCEDEQVVYRGDAILVEHGDDTLEGSGSSVSVAVGAPLELRVRCDPSSRNWTPVLVLVAGVAVVGVFVLLRVWRKRDMKKGKV